MELQQGLYDPDISNVSKETGGNLSDIKLELQKLNSLVPGVYDYIGITNNVDGNPTEVVYKTGGASGVTVSTLTITYDGTNILSVTKS